VRLIDQNGKQLGVLSVREAQRIASEASLDLVEIQPNSDPPVARIMDYGKFLFKQNKDRNNAKKKQKKIKIKEIKFRTSTDDNDYDIKMHNIRKFLTEGDKVKVTVWFKGREISHHELGLELLIKIREELAEVGKVEQFPERLEGKQMIMVLSSKNKIYN
jgi:translation initiation factor IF-3